MLAGRPPFPQRRKCEVSQEWLWLSLIAIWPPHVLSLNSPLEITSVLIKDLLRCTETRAQLRLSLKLWFLLQNFHWFCVRSRSWEPPCRIQRKLISGWPMVSSFLAPGLGELFIAPPPTLQILPLLLPHYAKWGDRTVILEFSFQQSAFRNVAFPPSICLDLWSL